MQIENIQGYGFVQSDMHLVYKKEYTWCGVLVDFRSQIKYSYVSFELQIIQAVKQMAYHT